MTRTTIDIDVTILEELKRRKRRDNKTLGQLASELLAEALVGDAQGRGTEPLGWATQAMAAQVDLEDKEALAALLDRS